MKVARLAIVAHYDRNNRIDEYFVCALQEIKQVCHSVLVVSTSSLEESEKEKLSKMGVQIMCRQNEGYDFMSWRVGLEKTDLTAWDEILICNDSCYGPLSSLVPVFEKMTTNSCDFWGMTANTYQAYHLQSYFLVFRKQVFMSKVFKDFWTSISILKNKQEVIKTYETQLTTILTKSGFRSATFFLWRWSFFKFVLKYLPWAALQIGARLMCLPLIPFSQRARRVLVNNIFRGGFANFIFPNPTHFFWEALLIAGVPYIKIELLRDNPKALNLCHFWKVISPHTSKNWMLLIDRHLDRLPHRQVTKLSHKFF